MKRLNILDSHTYPFNIHILKAFQERIEFTPIFGNNAWYKFEEKYSSTSPEMENDEVSELLDTHILVSLPELYALSDAKKIRDVYSVPVEYISPYEENKPKYKKVKIPTDLTFEYRGKNFFEQLSNNILRHEARLNGHHLLLVESALNYNVLPKKEGSQIYELLGLVDESQNILLAVPNESF